MAITWKNEKIIGAALVGFAGMLGVSAAQAQEISRAAVVAATCFTCHGTNGVSPGSIPSINEIPPDRMVSILQGFRSGQRASTVMGRHASGYTEVEIAEVANYLGNLQKQGK
ncbi:MAG: cytochrome subunit of sulfide dehydrogenase [Pseudomonadota bacterium]|nr:cytochrome subunit of sulfide dehydrogenase [Pseudomonadota bacterium]